MRIKQILSQHRRDFRAVFECESCDYEFERSGYDDTHFHNKVIPAMKCPKCGNTSPCEYRPLTTKYSDSEVV